MLVIPRKKAIFENLNSYYIDIPKLVEHFQGEIGTGSIYFKSASFEGVVFFEPDSILNGFYMGEDGQMVYMDDLSRLLEEASLNNFLLSVYPMSPDKIYFWSQIPRADRIYKDLSSEFTELQGLVKKMSAEKISGYIDVIIGQNKSGGTIFFKNGINLGGSYTWGNGELDTRKESLLRLVRESKEAESGAIFHFYQIDRKKMGEDEPTEEQSANHAEASPPSEGPPVEDVLRMLESLLGICEAVVEEDKKIKDHFTTLLKKKFMEKVDQYDFLDPFAAEFEYANRKISFTGSAQNDELTKGVFESVREMADELGIKEQLAKVTAGWSEKHRGDMALLGVSF